MKYDEPAKTESWKRVALIGVTTLAFAALVWSSGGIAISLDSPEQPAQVPARSESSADEPEAATAPLAHRVEGTLECETDNRASVPVPDVEPLELALDPRAPRTEREHYTDLLARLLRRDTDLLQSIASILDGPGADCRRLALLRALYDARAPEMESAFVHALSTLPAETAGSTGEPVPVVAAVFLARHAAADPTARHILASVAFDSGSTVQASLRRRVASAWAAAIDEAEMVDFPPRFYRDSDPLLQAGMIAALRENPHKVAAARLLDRLGIPPAAAPSPDPVDG